MESGGALVWPWSWRRPCSWLWARRPWKRKYLARRRKKKEKEFVPFVPSGAWEAYIHDGEGRDRTLVQPVEQNDDDDWRFLKFTDYKGPRGRLAILRVENKSINPQSEDDEDGASRSPWGRSRTCSRPPCSIPTASP